MASRRSARRESRSRTVTRTANVCDSRSCWLDVVRMRRTILHGYLCLCWAQSKPKLVWLYGKSSLFWCHLQTSESASCPRTAFPRMLGRLSVANRLCAMSACFGPTARAYCVMRSGCRAETQRSDRIASSSSPVISRFGHQRDRHDAIPL